MEWNQAKLTSTHHLKPHEIIYFHLQHVTHCYKDGRGKNCLCLTGQTSHPPGIYTALQWDLIKQSEWLGGQERRGEERRKGERRGDTKAHPHFSFLPLTLAAWSLELSYEWQWLRSTHMKWCVPSRMQYIIRSLGLLSNMHVLGTLNNAYRQDCHAPISRWHNKYMA